MNFDPKSTITPILLQNFTLLCYCIIYFQKFQQCLYVAKLFYVIKKMKSTQIIFKQETHSNIIWTLTIHKQSSLNFDDKKYIGTVSVTHAGALENNCFTANYES